MHPGRGGCQNDVVANQFRSILQTREYNEYTRPYLDESWGQAYLQPLDPCPSARHALLVALGMVMCTGKNVNLALRITKSVAGSLNSRWNWEPYFRDVRDMRPVPTIRHSWQQRWEDSPLYLPPQRTTISSLTEDYIGLAIISNILAGKSL